MDNDILEIVKKILEASRENKKFSIKNFIVGDRSKNEIQLLSNLFMYAPNINVTDILLRSSSYFNEWTVTDWKSLIENMHGDTTVCHWGLTIFFLNYTDRGPEFIREIGIDVEACFSDDAQGLKNKSISKMAELKMKSLNLTVEDIDKIRNYGAV